MLDLYRADDALIVKDTRPCAVAAEHRLEGLATELYLLCDGARGLPGLLRALAGRADKTEVRETLSGLLTAKLMAEMDGQYLSLAVVRNRAPRSGVPVTHVDLPVLQATDSEPLLHSL